LSTDKGKKPIAGRMSHEYIEEEDVYLAIQNSLADLNLNRKKKQTGLN